MSNLVRISAKHPWISGTVAGTLIGLLTSYFGLLSPWAIIILLLLPGGLIAAWIAYTHPIWIVSFLLIFMPVENLVLKFAPGSDQIYLVASFASELLIYMTFGLVVFRKLINSRPLRKTPIDGIVLVFLGIVILSILFNRAPLPGSFANVRSLIRYLFLFYLVANLDISPRQVSRMLYVIVGIGIFEICLGFLQMGVGGRLNEILTPRQVEASVGGISRGFVLVRRGREIGAIFGTLGDTIYFALFMLIVLTVYLSLIGRLRPIHFIFFGALFLAVNYAYARAVVFGVMLMLILFYIARRGIPKFLVRTYPFLLILLLAIPLLLNAPRQLARFTNPIKEQISILDNITGIFTKDYLLRAQNQRLGTLIGVVPTVLATHPVFGYGPDETTTIEELNHSVPSFLVKPAVKTGFEDVYWVAILAYYGLAGLLLWALLMLRLYMFAKKIYQTSSDSLTRGFAAAMLCLVVTSVALMFFYRIFEFRIFSFYFWLFAGLLASLYSRENGQLTSVPNE